MPVQTSPNCPPAVSRLPHPALCCFLLVPLILLFYCSQKNNSTLHRLNVPYPRVISFAPSITETFFALNLQNHLVGVTDFCTYPPDAAGLPRIGGYINPNYEQIMNLNPDVAVLLREHKPLIAFLRKREVKVVTIDNKDLSGILASIRTIGGVCGAAKRGDSLAAAIAASLEKRVSRPNNRPRVLFCVGRSNPGSGSIGKIFCAGPHSFYSELITRAGGDNAITDSTLAYPSIAGEGMLHLNPDIIIDVMAANRPVDPDKVKADWNKFPMINAVKTGAVYPLTGNYISIPGPRIVLIFNDLHRCIDDWNSRCSRGSACLHFR